MNPRIWLSALAILLIKHVTLAVGLLTPAQSVWAACEAEIQQAIERQLDNHRRVSPGHDTYHLKQQQDYWLQIDKHAKGGTAESCRAACFLERQDSETDHETHGL